MKEQFDRRHFLGYDLALDKAMQAVSEIEAEFIANVPDGAIIIAGETKIPGALAITLKSGCRLISQYDIQEDKIGACITVRYEMEI